MSEKPAIYTIGHSTHPLIEFTEILKSSGIEFLVDVRTIPRSRTNPQFNRDSLPEDLIREKIEYCHIAELGGLRSRQKSLADSPNSYWENKSFRNYADYAMSADFRRGLEELKAIARKKRCAIMCAEAVWWRCHRRIIADYLLAEGYPVFHIMGSAKTEPAKKTTAARALESGVLVYV